MQYYIDTGFCRADAYRIAAMVLDSRKTLKTIYISQADPDFYFGAGVLKTLFPDATLIASAPTVKKIQATLPTKLQVWGPRLGANAPANIPVPEVMSGNAICWKARCGKSGGSRILSRSAARLDPVAEGHCRRRQCLRRAARLDGGHADGAGAGRLEP